MEIHKEYYKKVHEKAVDKLAMICDEHAAESSREVCEQLADVLKHGSTHQMAKAIMAVAAIVWAKCELNEE